MPYALTVRLRLCEPDRYCFPPPVLPIRRLRRNLDGNELTTLPMDLFDGFLSLENL